MGNNNKKSIIFRSILFIIVTCFCFWIIYYTLEYNILIHHDQIFRDKEFLKPNHGRYISSFLSCALSYTLPNFLSIHPNDSQILFTTPIKALCICSIIFLLTNALFIFDKSKLKFLKIEFIFAFFILFLFLFNNKNTEQCFIITRESTIFFEYPFSLLFYIPFIGIILKDYIVGYNNYKFSFKLFLFFILTFLSGITPDITNVTILYFLAIILFIYIIQNRKFLFSKKLKDKTKVYFTTFFIYILSLVCYYIQPADDHILYLIDINQYKYYFQNYFLPFYIKQYIAIYIILFGFMCILLSKKNYKTSITLIISILSPIFAYLFSMVIGNGEFPFVIQYKFRLVYKLFLFFTLLYFFGYLVDTYKTKIKPIYLKISFFLLILFFNFNNLILNYIDAIEKERTGSKIERKILYEIEKIALTTLNNDSKELILPTKYATRNFLPFDTYNYCLKFYLTNIYSYFKSLENIRYKSNINYDYLFTEKELQELKFENLYEYAKELNKYNSN